MQFAGSAYEKIRKRYSCGALRKVAFEEEKIPTTILTSSQAAVLAVSPYLHSMVEGVERKAKTILFDTKACMSYCETLVRNQDCGNCSGKHLPVTLLPAKRLIGGSFLPLTDTASTLTVHCSEPILTEYRCVVCEDQYIKLFALASTLNEEFAVCPVCQNNTRDVSRISDQFAISELLDKYAGFDMPCKYISVEHQDNTYLIEFEGVSGERDC